MAKKKKEGKKKEVEVEEEPSAIANILHADAKRSLLLVFLITFGLLSVLGFFEAAGLLGHWIDIAIGSLFGYGKWLLPILLFTLAGLMLFRRTTTAKETVKYIGLVVIYLTILALIHLGLGDDSRSLLKLAEAGEGGGYFGYALANVFFILAGRVAAAILLTALFIAGLIMAFNVSLIGFLEGLGMKATGLLSRKEKETEVYEEDGEDEEVLDEEEVIETDEPDEEETALEQHNISHLDFPDDEEEVMEDDEEEDELDEEEAPAPKKPRRSRSRYAWKLPGVDLLESTTGKAAGGDTERNKHIIQSTLKHFGIEVTAGEVRVGPTVTQYTFRPAFGVKLSRITTLNQDLALALAAKSVRIEAPIPGQALIGIEVPNQSVATVRLKEILEGPDFRNRKGLLTMVLGQDVSGKQVLADLAKMPHVLIAGRTGSGKSVCMNTILLSILYQASPEDVKLILVDPKRVSFSRYKDIPHLKTSVIVENKRVINALKWAVAEMDTRYKILEEARVQDIQSYHEAIARGDKKTVVNTETGEISEKAYDHMPYIVIMIDEMADLMATNGKEVEAAIVRLASLSRAVGIHLVLATQRPEATVITGLIKANIPARISFQLRSHIDSRTILDTGGAEKLLGNGDMLYSAADGKEMKRIQGVFVSDDEIKRVTTFLIEQKKELGDDEDDDPFGEATNDTAMMDALDAVDNGAEQDEMYIRAREIIINSGKASTTSLQTVLGIGYPKAARLMNLMEENGVVGMVDGKKKVLVGKAAEREDDEEQKYGDDHLREEKEREKWSI
jgi:DNA segregation ATPase FtsK/SpoIIIE, S-DNA-T family